MLFASAVAAAGAAPAVFAEELSDQEYNISSESESLGTFGTEDTSVNESLDDLIEDVGAAGFDFFSPSPVPDSVSVNSAVPSAAPFAEPSATPFVSDPDDSDDDFIEPLANYNTYYGSISTTHLEFMRGFLPKLGFKEHYVASRVSQYDYIFAYGEDLTYNGSSFIGSGVTVITWNTYNNGSYTSGVQSSFSLHPGSFMVYSDLSRFYPGLADTAGFSLRQILILLTTFILGVVIDHMYQVRKIRRVK